MSKLYKFYTYTRQNGLGQAVKNPGISVEKDWTGDQTADRGDGFNRRYHERGLYQPSL